MLVVSMQFRFGNYLKWAFALSFVMGGCASHSKLQFLAPEYKPNSQFSAKLLVMPLSSELINNNMRNGDTDATVRELSGSDKAFFYRYFGAVLSDVTTARVFGINPRFKPENVELTYKKLNLDENNSIAMYVPKSGKIEFEDEIPDFVLFVDDVYFDTKYEERMSSLGSGSREKYTMDTGMEYALWDNQKQQIAAYGRLKKSHNLIAMPAKENYLKALEFFASSIIKKSPMVIKQALF